MKTQLQFLLVTMDGGGNLPPVMSTVKKLMNRGHRAHMLSEPCLQEVAEQTGLSFSAFTDYFTRTNRTEDFFKDWKKGLTKDPALENVVLGPAKTMIEQTLTHIAKIKPDVILIDTLFLPVQIAAEITGIPSVILFHMPEYLPGANRPPGVLGLLPGKGILGHWRDKLLAMIFHSVMDQYLPKLNSIRKDHKLPALQHTADLMHRAQLRLIQTSRAFDFPLNPAPANVRYMGPVIEDPDWVEPWEYPIGSEQSLPLVVVSLSSTFQNQGATLQACMDALSSLPVRGLVTTGPSLNPDDFRYGKNVVVTRTAPHSRIFPMADLVITHAGHGTIMRALSHGKPMLCIPAGRDQMDNAAKVKFHGAGLTISKNTRSGKIAAYIQKILHTDSFTTSAQKWSGIIHVDSQQETWMGEVEALGNSKKEIHSFQTNQA